MNVEEKPSTATPRDSTLNAATKQMHRNWPMRVWHFYYDGFRNMSPLGKRLWIIILIKLFLFFVVLKLFFFPDLLKRDYDNDTDRAQAVRSTLTSPRQ